ncbi:zinc ABC transporter substrate-binding protein [Curtobacterium sp. Csp2]|nr:zinc ABC transporter substrate-binding protein [Curtobacterium sp. Csp2]
MQNRRLLALPLVAGAAALVLTGCATSSSPGSASSDGTVRVVASTNVYGSIVQSIGGKDVEVTSILDDPSQDPHSFESSAKTQLAVSKADLLIENGGGYDDFMTTLAKSANTKAPTINVVDLSGVEKDGDKEFNEHVFYSYPTMVKLVAEVEQRLAKLDAGQADTFAANAKTLTTKLERVVEGGRRDVVALLDRLREGFGRDVVEAHRLEQVPRDGLGVGDLVPVDLLLLGGGLRLEVLELRGERLRVRREGVGLPGVELRQPLLDLGHELHHGGVAVEHVLVELLVPVLLDPGQVDHVDGGGLRVRGLRERGHEVVVAAPVLDEQVGLRDRELRLRARLERVRVLRRVVEDARHLDVLPTDRLHDRAVDVRRGDHADRAVARRAAGGRGGRAAGQDERGGAGDERQGEEAAVLHADDRRPS